MNLEYPGSDTLAINPDTPPGSRPLLRPEPLIKADKLGWLLWDVADIDQQEEYLCEFGMLTHSKEGDTLYMRSYGDGPCIYVIGRALCWD